MLLRFFDYHTKELVGKYNDMDDYLEKVGGMAKGDPIRISRENGVTITGVKTIKGVLRFSTLRSVKLW